MLELPDPADAGHRYYKEQSHPLEINKNIPTIHLEDHS